MAKLTQSETAMQNPVISPEFTRFGPRAGVEPRSVAVLVHGARAIMPVD